MEYKRNCPKCGKEIKYKQESTLNKAIKKKSLCNTCCRIKISDEIIKEYNENNGIRICPECGKEIKYKNLSNYANAKIKNCICTSCCIKKGIKIQKIAYEKKLKNNAKEYDDNNGIRKCPKCGKEIKYKNLKSYIKANKNNDLCLICKREITKAKKIKELISRNKLRICKICGKKIKVNKNDDNNNFICKKCINNINIKKYDDNNGIRKCPKCGKEIKYKNLKSYIKANKNNDLCLICKHHINEYNKNNGIRKCLKCGKEIKYNNLTDFIDNKYYKCDNCKNNMNKGKNNGMYGKYIYNVWVEKYGKDTANKKLKKMKQKHRETFKKNDNGKFGKKMSKINSNKNNGMYGKSFYDVWIEKYGKDTADEKLVQYKQNKKIEVSGKNNPMYGKPPSYKSGNGWSGHYKNIQFRSMLELYYLIYLIDNNIPFENGELKKHHIEYEMDGMKRNYLPDFYLIDTDQTIEIKPKNLVNSYQNKLKFAAAKQKLGNKHIILTEDDIQKVDIEKLYILYQKGDLVFDIKYEDKFKKYCKNKLISL